MKKISIVLLIAVVSIVNCQKKGLSSAECKPAVDKLVNNLIASAKPEEVEKFNQQKPAFIEMLEKQCRTGNYDLSCLEKQNSIPGIQACVKK